MKHQLLCTSAIALCVAASSAAAQEWDVKVGGFITNEAYMPDSGELKESVEVGGLEHKVDTELAVSPSITLDNGLTVSASLQWELVGDTNADDTFVTVSGPGLGSLTLGQTNGAGLSMTVGAPNATAGGFNEWFPGAKMLKAATGANSTSNRNDNGYVFGQLSGAAIDAADYETGYDSARVIYKTPSFNGLTLGISYGADNNSANGNSNQRDANEPMRATNLIDFGASFSQSFGDANVSLSAAMGQANVNKRRSATETADDGGSISNWSVGGKVTFGAITVGGTIAENNALGDYENPTALVGGTGDNASNPISGNTASANRVWSNGDTDHSGMNFGISYDAPGPWAFSVTMSQGTSSWKELDLGTGNQIGGDNTAADSMKEMEVDRTAFVVGAAQSLGKGVTWSIWYNSQERGAASASVFGTSLGISF